MRRLSLDYAGDALPGEEPQAQADDPALDTHDWNPTHTYKWFYGNGQFHISEDHGHDELASHSGIQPDHKGPMAMGYAHVDYGKATFEVTGNIHAQGIARILKDYCKTQNWRWGGLTDIQGEPIGTGSEFAPVKSMFFGPSGAGLERGPKNNLDFAKNRGLLNKTAGIVHIDGDLADVRPIKAEWFPALKEWADDFGLQLCSGNNNVIKRIEDLETKDVYSPEWNDEEDHFLFRDPPDERLPGGVFRCPGCAQIFPNWNAYKLHRRKEEPEGDPIDDGKFPEIQNDPIQDSHTSDQPKFYEASGAMRNASVDPRYWTQGGCAEYALALHDRDPSSLQFGRHVEYDEPEDPDFPEDRLFATNHVFVHDDKNAYDALGTHPLPYEIPNHDTRYGEHRNDIEGEWDNDPEMIQEAHRQIDEGITPIQREWRSSSNQPKDLIPGAAPFLYSIKEDRFHIGAPGQTADQLPSYTPGGEVIGSYEPGGKVIIYSVTNMPFSVRHMLELWYAQLPQMEIKSVYLQDDTGKQTKLAAQDPGQLVASMVAADPVTWKAKRALEQAGGHVYVVGGAVRDAFMGKAPKDLDLMVTGLPGEAVHQALKVLPGSIKLTGKDFGVYRYAEGGNEVEVALPRTEQSSGEGHKDFNVKVDHNMTPEQDLYRRDFTANAMAVDLADNQVIDPYGGASDIQNNRLRTLNTKSLADDPLRAVRGLVAHARYGLEPDDDTRQQMEDNAAGLQNLPKERIQEELDKLFSAKKPGDGIRLAEQTGLLPYIFPEVQKAMGHDQNNPHHEFLLGDHLTNVLDRVSQRSDDKDLRLAGLLHDIGKVDSHWTECRDCGAAVNGHADQCINCGSNNTSGHFYENRLPDGQTVGQDHETVGAQQAAQRMRDLKYPNDRIQRVQGLVQRHMYPHFSTEKGARRFLAGAGDHADDLLDLRWADQGGKNIYPTDPTASIDQEQALLERVRTQQQPTNTAQLAINGNDLIAAGYQPGPIMGQILQGLTQKVIDDPALNNRDELLNLTRDLWPQ